MKKKITNTEKIRLILKRDYFIRVKDEKKLRVKDVSKVIYQLKSQGMKIIRDKKALVTTYKLKK